MSRADEMLKELGYKEQQELRNRRNEVWGVRYVNYREDCFISFDLVGKSVCIGTGECAVYATLEEILAINEKCKELGWFEWAEQ